MTREWQPGDRVRVCDQSEAHGDLGTVDTIQENGIILVELEGRGGCLWPVFGGEELEEV